MKVGLKDTYTLLREHLKRFTTEPTTTAEGKTYLKFSGVIRSSESGRGFAFAKLPSGDYAKINIGLTR